MRTILILLNLYHFKGLIN